jgi:roadblock/LC7 domain-containing protein
MKLWTRWLYIIAGLAAVFVAGSAIALAVRQDSWAPIVAVGWIPAVLVAVAGGGYRHHRRGRSGRAA